MRSYRRLPRLVAGLRLLWLMVLMAGLTLYAPTVPVTAAASFTVNSTADATDFTPGNGICETAIGNGICTLRAAIQEANALPGSDTITLPPGLYVLTRTGGDNNANSGDLDITNSLTLTGAGADQTIILGGSSFNSRIFQVFTATVQISGVTIQNGNSGSSSGGGLRNEAGGQTTLTNVAVVSNTTSSTGGGLLNSGVLTLTNGVVLSNTADAEGGGIRNAGGTLTLMNLTVSGNAAKSDGGGIRNTGGGTATLNNVTVTRNTADSDANGSGDGGGISRTSGTFTVMNTLIGGNFDNSAGTKHPDCSGTLVSQGYNLLGNNTGCNLPPTTGDLIGIQSNPIDPLLGPLQNNGGSTLTHALLSGSSAADAGNPAPPGSGGNACEATDQRDIVRPQGSTCDIGAYEVVVYGLTLAPATEGKAGIPGATVTYTLTLTNTGNVTDTYSVTIAGAVFTTTATLPTVGPFAPNQGGTFVVSVQIPPSAIVGTMDNATVTVRSQGNNSQSAAATLTTTVVAVPVTGGVVIYLPVIAKNP